MVLCAILPDRSFLREIEDSAAGADLPHDPAGMIFLKTLFNCQAAICENTSRWKFGFCETGDSGKIRFLRFHSIPSFEVREGRGGRFEKKRFIPVAAAQKRNPTDRLLPWWGQTICRIPNGSVPSPIPWSDLCHDSGPRNGSQPSSGSSLPCSGVQFSILSLGRILTKTQGFQIILLARPG